MTQPLRSQNILSCQFIDFFVFENLARHYATKFQRKKTYYDILEVKPSATPKEIRGAFIRLSKEFHPDKNPNDPSLHRTFAQINEAYSILKKRSKNKSQNRKTTGEQNLSDSSFDYWGPDDYHDMEHYAYMSSREYYHYTKQSMREHEARVHRMNNEEAPKGYSYSGVIIALLATLSIGVFKYYLSKRKDDRSEERKQRDSAYFSALAQKIYDDRKKLREARLERRHKVFDFSGTDLQNKQLDKSVLSSTDKNNDLKSISLAKEVDKTVKPPTDVNSSSI